MTIESTISPETAEPQPATNHHDQRQVRVRVDARDIATCYANAFRGNASAEEVMIDFGINMVINAPLPPSAPPPRIESHNQSPDSEIHLKLSNRVIMNYHTAKRLTILLSNMIRHHEERFGELKLDAGSRPSPDESKP